MKVKLSIIDDLKKGNPPLREGEHFYQINTIDGKAGTDYNGYTNFSYLFVRAFSEEEAIELLKQLYKSREYDKVRACSIRIGGEEFSIAQSLNNIDIIYQFTL